MAVSIRDVAKAAGVSVGTVSRAFNNYTDIRDETKRAILLAAQELGYVPNLNAKILSGKRHQTMAIILAGFMTDKGLTDELVIKMLRGACFYGIGHNIEFATYVISSEQQRRKSFEQFCSEHSLDGAVCFGLKTTDVYYDSLKTSQMPCVAVDIPLEGERVGSVGTDNAKAYDELTQLALHYGHKRMVFLNGRQVAAVCHERLDGLTAALQRAGLELEENIYTDFSVSQSEQIVTDYLRRYKTSGASIFLCASDYVAMGAAKGIQKSGYRVGKDFSVVGFDGLDIAKLSEPSIATVDQNMEKKGYAAAKLLNDIINGRAKSNCLCIPYTIINGGSLGFA